MSRRQAHAEVLKRKAELFPEAPPVTQMGTSIAFLCRAEMKILLSVVSHRAFLASVLTLVAGWGGAVFRKRLREQSLYFRHPPFSLGRDPVTGFYSFSAPAPPPSHRESVVTRKPWGGEWQQVLFCTWVKQPVTGHRGPVGSQAPQASSIFKLPPGFS